MTIQILRLPPLLVMARNLRVEMKLLLPTSQTSLGILSLHPLPLLPLETMMIGEILNLVKPTQQLPPGLVT